LKFVGPLPPPGAAGTFASAVVVSIEIDVVIVVVIVVVLWGQVDIVTSSRGHFCHAKALNSLINTPVVFQMLVVVCEFL
jgi:hypothetical protein